MRSRPGQKLSMPLRPWCKNSVVVCVCDLQMFSGQGFGYLSALIASLCLNGTHYLPLFFFASYFTICQTK